MQTPFVFPVLGLPCFFSLQTGAAIITFGEFYLSYTGRLSSLLYSFLPVSKMSSLLTPCLSVQIIYARFISHHRSVLMTHLYSLSNCQRYYPHLSINSRLCQVCLYLAFGVSMSFPPLPWIFVQPALLWVKELRAVGSSHYPSLFNQV